MSTIIFLFVVWLMVFMMLLWSSHLEFVWHCEICMLFYSICDLFCIGRVLWPCVRWPEWKMNGNKQQFQTSLSTAYFQLTPGCSCTSNWYNVMFVAKQHCHILHLTIFWSKFYDILCCFYIGKCYYVFYVISVVLPAFTLCKTLKMVTGMTETCRC